ncbi:MAG: RuBisCO large subunit C-terminal-like domain-containing protein [Solirubrobacteraceae bacterium]
MIRATYELAPPGSAAALARLQTTGLAAGDESVRGRVISADGELAVLEFPDANWGANVPLLVSTLVAGEATEKRAFTRCRLIELELPDELLPGPAFGARPGDTGTTSKRAAVGLIVKPQIGLRPDEFAAVARVAVDAGADLIKDDEVLGDPPICPLEDRVRAMVEVLTDHPGVVYCPNVTGPSGTLVQRAARVVELGATGVMVNAFAQGLDSILSLRQADLGVPILAHRAGSGPIARNEDFGATGDVLARLTRLCGADHVIVGAFAGGLFEDDRSTERNLSAVRGPCGRARPSVAVLGGGVGPANAAAQVARAGGGGLMVLLGAAAYDHPGGVGEAVRATVDALGR